MYMHITEVSVWKDRKVQVAQYEPISFAYGMKIALDDGDDPKKAYAEAEKFVDEMLKKETAAVQKLVTKPTPPTIHSIKPVKRYAGGFFGGGNPATDDDKRIQRELDSIK